MTLRKWGYLFLTTLLWGTLATTVVGLLIVATIEDFNFFDFKQAGLDFGTIMFIVLFGATVSALSQMGFFAYMILRYIAIGVFRKRWIWDLIQVSLVIITFIDMIYLSYTSFGQEGETWIAYSILPVILLLIALVVSYWKMKLTKSSAFIPTLFFMFVVTVLEAVPALQTNSLPANFFMLTPLVVSNAWQILRLHRIVQKELA